MNLGSLRSEFQSRGYDHIESTRANRWINQSYLELCEEAAWPFLETSSTGTAPLTVSDVRTVLSVTDTTQGIVLDAADRRDIVAQDPQVDDTGTPYYFYLDGNVVRVYPANTTDTIVVRYLEVPDEMDDDADEPVVPARFQDLIVDGAVYRALKDNDEWEGAGAMRTFWEAGVARMRRSLLDRQWATTGRIVITDLEGWSV